MMTNTSFDIASFIRTFLSTAAVARLGELERKLVVASRAARHLAQAETALGDAVKSLEEYGSEQPEWAASYRDFVVDEGAAVRRARAAAEVAGDPDAIREEIHNLVRAGQTDSVFSSSALVRCAHLYGKVHAGKWSFSAWSWRNWQLSSSGVPALSGDTEYSVENGAVGLVSDERRADFVAERTARRAKARVAQAAYSNLLIEAATAVATCPNGLETLKAAIETGDGQRFGAWAYIWGQEDGRLQRDARPDEADIASSMGRVAVAARGVVKAITSGRADLATRLATIDIYEGAAEAHGF